MERLAWVVPRPDYGHFHFNSQYGPFSVNCDYDEDGENWLVSVKANGKPLLVDRVDDLERAKNLITEFVRRLPIELESVASDVEAW